MLGVLGVLGVGVGGGGAVLGGGAYLSCNWVKPWTCNNKKPTQ